MKKGRRVSVSFPGHMGGVGFGEVISPGEEKEEKYLLFRVGPFCMALPLAVLKKIYDTAGFPFRTAGSRMVDLHRLSGVEAGREAGYWVELEISEGRYLIPVEDVEDIRELNLAVPIPYPAVLARPESRYISRLFFDGSRMISLIAASSLVEVMEESQKQRLKAKLPRKIPSGSASKSPAPKKGLTIPGDVKAEGSDPGKKVVFSAEEERWMVDLNRVVQILNVEEIFSLPSAGPKISGVIYFAESAVPVMPADKLAGIAGGSVGGTGGGMPIVVIVETGKGPLGLGCERIVMVKEDGEAGKGPEADGSGRGEPILVRPELLLPQLFA